MSIYEKCLSVCLIISFCIIGIQALEIEDYENIIDIKNNNIEILQDRLAKNNLDFQLLE